MSSTDKKVPKTTFGETERADGDLWRSCVKGDPSAWEQLVDRFQRLVFAIPRRAGLSNEECADVFQDVFLLLFQKLDKIEQPERIRSWIVSTAKFKSWSIIRARKGKISSVSDEEMSIELERIADHEPLADARLTELEEQHMIRVALGSLDQRCRTILSMLYLHDPAASYSAVAKEIRVGETSISPMRARCLKKLKKILDG